MSKLDKKYRKQLKKIWQKLTPEQQEKWGRFAEEQGSGRSGFEEFLTYHTTEKPPQPSPVPPDDGQNL